MRRHPLLVLAPVGALLLIALLVGLARTATYTASARLAVGGLNSTNPASFTGFADAAQQLAQTYSRSVQGDGVVGTVAQTTGMSQSEVRSDLAAAPIPETAVFTLKATSGSEDDAVQLANLASQALVAEVEAANQANPTRLLQEYRTAELERQQLTNQVNARAANGGSGLAAAQAELLAAEARTTSLRNAYEASQQSGTVPLEIIEKADHASGDRSTRIQILAFIAVLVGLILGMALALFRDSAVYPGASAALGRARARVIPVDPASDSSRSQRAARRRRSERRARP
jgi:capsular polysaccharide biosynthesis protein